MEKAGPHLSLDCASYPSGRIAVCQTPSGLLCGGYYTNVFGDTPEQDILATFTALGCGSVTYPLR